MLWRACMDAPVAHSEWPDPQCCMAYISAVRLSRRSRTATCGCWDAQRDWFGTLTSRVSAAMPWTGCAYRWMSGVSTLTQLMKACPMRTCRTFEEGPSDKEWCRTAPAHLVPSNDELARRAARYMPGGDMYEPGA